MRLINRFKKTGSYFKKDDENFNVIIAAAESAVVVDDANDYGNEDYGNDYANYEGGEKEKGFVDIEGE